MTVVVMGVSLCSLYERTDENAEFNDMVFTKEWSERVRLAAKLKVRFDPALVYPNPDFTRPKFSRSPIAPETSLEKLISEHDLRLPKSAEQHVCDSADFSYKSFLKATYGTGRLPPPDFRLRLMLIIGDWYTSEDDDGYGDKPKKKRGRPPPKPYYDFLRVMRDIAEMNDIKVTRTLDSRTGVAKGPFAELVRAFEKILPPAMRCPPKALFKRLCRALRSKR